MKILHVPFTFYPDPSGGTEVYVAALAREQQRLEVFPVIAAPAGQGGIYTHDGIPVHRYAIGDVALSLRELYGEGNPVALAGFQEVLDHIRPDVVHLHALTAAVSLSMARAARRQGARVVFTYHTPTVSCQRGTLLRWGREVCDGVMEVNRCAACALDGFGLPRLVSRALGALPPATGQMLGRAGCAGGPWTALRMTELVALRHWTVSALLAEVDCVVAVSQWVYDLLLSNQTDPDKVILSRQGLGSVPFATPVRPRPAGAPLRLVFLGRLSRAKGLHILQQAMHHALDLRVRLDILGVAQDDEGRRVQAELSQAGDGRIRILPPVVPAAVVTTLAHYDLLVVPSQGLETGPLVVYEAFAAGVPVLGSHLGGIAELVTHEQDGLLVDAASPKAWAAALRRLVDDPDLLVRLRQGIRFPRTMRDVAREMLDLYQRMPRQLTA